jgi:hypothetical protein
MPAHLAAFVLALSALAADAKVVPLTGGEIEGKLTALTADEIIIAGKSGPQTIAAADVMGVEFPAPDKPLEKPAVWIDLLDGSKLLAETYVAAAGKSSVQLVGGPAVQIPTRSIAAVRFRQQDAELSAQWRAIAGGMPAGDLLVVRKTSTRMALDGDNEPKTVTETALDELDGTILEITPDSVQFEFDGEKLDVKREKIEGVVYYYAVRREFPPAACRLTDAGGSLWNLRSVELAGERLSITTAAGAAVELPVSAVAKIDFSVGNVAFLSNLEPDTGGGEPLVSLQPAAMSAKFGRVFHVSQRPPLGADKFRISTKDGEKQFDRGLSLHSPLSLVYRVPEGFKKLHALAGVDNSVLIPGRFSLVVLGDGKELARHEFGPENRGLVAIDLDVAAVKRITIVLDPAGDQDIGDQLNLCEARFTK